ncbi:phage antirepressor KilAC domain-containing protein [Rahnella variigena]|uniref:phage antirepressor KilAC domain-containing protein n=1 Tax=Rahnella variigena TaxID=574964 RepID=UPI003D2A48A5
MSNSLLSGKVVTMSSREIAELVQSKHSDVKRSAERLAVGGVLTAPLAQFEFEHNGNRYFEYRFNKRDSLVLVARLSPEFTAAVVDRWQELESKSQLPQSLPEALRLAADLADEKLALESQLALAAPKVEFVEQYVMAKGSMGFRAVCKLLHAKEPEFRMFLLEKDIVYRLEGQLTPKANHLEAGRFEVKTGTSQQNQHAFRQARFTAKGVEWVARLWAGYLRQKQEAHA